MKEKNAIASENIISYHIIETDNILTELLKLSATDGPIYLLYAVGNTPHAMKNGREEHRL